MSRTSCRARLTGALVAAALTATVATLTTVTAVAAPAEAGTGSPLTAGAAHPRVVVQRAARALDQRPDGRPAAPVNHPRRIDATLALRDLFLARPTLGGDDSREADHLLARPTDGPRDPYGDGYSVPSTMRCSRHFCVHYVTTTADEATGAQVSLTLRTMEQVWAHHIGQLGYRPPPSDGHRGGNAKFDVYLKELGNQGLYGYCAPERKVPGEPHAASGFCVLDNDFSRAEFHTLPVDALRVTAAHEFFHAIQFGYDYREDPWILEATAVWMEERFADSINDNRQYLPYGQVGIPSAPLDTFSSTGFNQYGNWPFFEYLSEHYGNKIVRQIWQHLGNGKRAKDYSIQGVARVLRKHHGLTSVFTAYAAGNQVPGKTYAEGRHFPATQVAARHTFSTSSTRWSTSTRIDHLAARDVQVTPGSTLSGDWKLTISVDGPPAATSPGAYLVVRKGQGRITRHPVHLDADGNGHATLSFGHGTVKGIDLTLANVSTRYTCSSGTTFSCRGLPKDDGQRFSVTMVAQRR